MDPDRWEKVAELFKAARATPDEQRSTYLEEQCAGDAELRAEVESLLKHHDASQPFLVDPALGADFDVAKAEPRSEEILAALPANRRIGRYEIRHVIAAGGMGTVYEAVQDHPHRLVALKVLRRGVASRQAMKRFRHETEILGRLKHPNIAQIYDAGTFDEGEGAQPYFAMEHVRGEPLIQCAESKKLGIRDRLDLFVKVCDAVQYAHQRGVIHRDLKPDNILVDSTSGGAEPKVLDFGVAKATDSDIQATTLQTDIGQLIGTVPYMSPEQVTGDPSELDTRSDVYSLGVVLYELMCGRLPHDLRDKNIPEAVRVIREEDPTPLSSVNKIYRGDIDTIVAKALEKDKDRRYQTAAELAADVRHFLKDEPIVARPASTFYQVRKFARRNRALVGGVIVAFVAMTLGTAVATWQAVRAKADASRAVATKEFLADMLGTMDFKEAGRQLTVREILDAAVDGIEVRFADQPEIKAEVLHIIGWAYTRAMGDFDKSIELLGSALNIRKGILGEDHPDTLESSHRLGFILLGHMQFAEAEELLRWTVERRGRTLGEDHPDTLRSITGLVMVLGFRGKLDEAEALGRRALDGLARVLGNEHRSTLEARWTLGAVLGWSGKRGEAIALNRETLEIARRTLGPEHFRTLAFANALGTWMAMDGRWEEAEPLLRWSFETRQRLFGKDDYQSLRWMEFFGWSLHRNGNTEAGEPLLREAVRRLRRTKGERHLTTAYAMIRLGGLERDLGNLERAEDLLLQCIDIQREELSDEHHDTLNTIDALASILAKRGKLDEAEVEYLRLIEGRKRVLGPDHRNTLRSMNELADLYEAWGKPEQAAEWRAKLPE